VSSPAEREASIEGILGYHDRTKHYPTRFARSLGYLDWDNQPNPFRRYEGAELVPLRLDREESAASQRDLYGAPGIIAAAPLSRASLSRFLELSLAITAWKEFKGSRWALRSNPSSGNLHPTEGTVIIPPMVGVSESAAVAHYAAKEHALEVRAQIPPEVWREAAAELPEGAWLIGLSSIHWREAWKYGERAYRYCQHDVGHAIGAARMAAATLGWRLEVLADVSDAEVASALGLDRDADFEGAEREEPDLLALVAPAGSSAAPAALGARIAQAARGAQWRGLANPLSRDHVDWEIIDRAADSAQKPIGTSWAAPGPSPVFCEFTDSLGADLRASAVIRARRSAVDFDGNTPLDADRFFAILDRTLPRSGRAPFDSLPGAPSIHLAIFVHRVTGLAPGLYLLARDPARVAELRASLRPAFEWAAVDGAPSHLPLFLLKRGDMRDWGRSISCDQGIAGDGAFSLGMIAHFEDRLRESGPWMYRRLHWEAGLIGQVLYLEATSAGIRGTGIGCFFDDEMHGVLGIKNHALHTLYHFAVGNPVEDARLTTLPAYADAAFRV